MFGCGGVYVLAFRGMVQAGNMDGIRRRTWYVSWLAVEQFAGDRHSTCEAARSVGLSFAVPKLHDHM